MNVIYLFIINGFRFSNFFQTYYMLKNGNGTKLLRQLITIKLILLRVLLNFCACIKRLGGAYC